MESYTARESCHRCGEVRVLGKDKLCAECRDGKTVQCKKCGKPGKVVPDTGLCPKCEAERLKVELEWEKGKEKPPLSAGKVRQRVGGKRKAPQTRSKAIKSGKCARCGRKRDLPSRGLCGSCYSACRRTGTLEDFPKIPRGKKGAAEGLSGTLKAYGKEQKPIPEKIDLYSRISEIQESIAKECEDLVKCLLQMAEVREEQAAELRERAEKCTAIIKRMRENAL